MKLQLRLFIFVLMCLAGRGAWAETMGVDFESNMSTYTNWTYSNITARSTSITAHGGSYHGVTNSTTEAYVCTSSAIASPTSITCYYSKTTKNTNAGSKFQIQVSSDGSTGWTDVADGNTMNNVTLGTWYELTADLSSYSNVYVRVYYTGTTAVRAIDDIVLTYSSGSSTPTISFGFDSQTMLVGETNTWTATGTNLGGATISYSSDDTSVATVDSSTGEVTGVAPGTARITASATVSGTTYPASYDVTVAYGTATASISPASILVGGTASITTTPAGMTATYNPSDTNIATVASDGTVTGAGVGDATITTTWGQQTVGGITYAAGSATLSVSVALGTANASINTTTIAVGTTATITTVPAGLTVNYKTSDASVATAASGTVTGVGSGPATITASWDEQNVDGIRYAQGSQEFNITVEAAAREFSIFSGDLVEGDYIIYYSGKAMNTTVSGSRLQYAEVTPIDDVITTNDKSIIWHIAPSGDYWTIFNEEEAKFAASTGAKNAAGMLADGTNAKALWTVSGSSTYEFVNKQNTTNGVNANLRENSTYGFACYSTSTGGALTLYKAGSSTPVKTLTVSPATIALGSVTVGDALSETISVTQANLESDLSVSLTGNGSVSTATIAHANGTTTFTWTYTPSSAGAINATITVSGDGLTQTVTITGSATAPAGLRVYKEYTGAITEGDYIIYFQRSAMKNSLTDKGRSDFTSVTPECNVIRTSDDDIVWHISASATEGYYNIYNASAGYLANKSTSADAHYTDLITNATSEHALWSFSCNEDGKYDIFNKYRLDNEQPAYLRRNNEHGFACYEPVIGGPITLYKYTEDPVVLFSPEGGTYSTGQNVELISTVTGCTIYYTTDGSTPTTSSNIYNNTPISVTETTTIKAFAYKNGTNYDVSSQKYSIRATFMFIETFDEFSYSSGGTDGVFNAANSTAIIDAAHATQSEPSTDVSDNEGWTFEKAYPARKCIKVGTSNVSTGNGSATTPTINFVDGEVYYMTFKAAPWLNETNLQLNLSISSGTISPASVTLTDGMFTTYTVMITSAGPAQITFTGAEAGKNRFYLDDIGIAGEGYQYDEIGANKYAVRIYPFETALPDGIVIYSINDYNPTSHKLALEAEEVMDGKTPYILYNSNDERVMYVFEIDEDEDYNDLTIYNDYSDPTNKTYSVEAQSGACSMVGSFLGLTTPVSTDEVKYYGLQTQNGRQAFYKITSSQSMPRYRAYLKVETSSDIKEIGFGFGDDDESTGIVDALNAMSDGAVEIFTMSGIRIPSVQKGMNIIRTSDGKVQKVLVK